MPIGVAPLERRKSCTYAPSQPKSCLHTCLHTVLDGEETRRKTLITNGTNYSQLFSAAQSRDQAAILFSLAAKIVRMSPDLNAVVAVRDTAKQLACQELGTLYRALSAEASTAYGLSPVFTVHDELGQVKGPRSELYEARKAERALGSHYRRGRPTREAHRVTLQQVDTKVDTEKSEDERKYWSGRRDLNSGPLAPHASALPDCATSRPTE